MTTIDVTSELGDRYAGGGETVDCGLRVLARDGNRVAAGFVDLDVVAVTVKGDRDPQAVGTPTGLTVTLPASSARLLQDFQVGHPAATAALSGPVVMVVVGETLKTAALREEA